MDKIGRPKLNNDKALACHVAFRMTPAERVELAERAAVAGYTLSDFARRTVMRGKHPAPRPNTTAGVFSADDRRALLNLGNNLNQAIQLAHSGRQFAAETDLRQTAQALHDVLDRYLPK